LLVHSQDEQGITLRGPTRPSQGWQQQVTGAYPLEQVTVAWEQQQGCCPQGKRSGRWQEDVTPDGRPSILVSFRRQDCHACPTRPVCPQSRQHLRRLRLPPREQDEALAAARPWYGSEEGIERSKQRAGGAGTLAQGVRALGWRRTRYRGVPKTHMQHVAIAAALNVERMVAWLDERPRATTRTSRFAALAPARALNLDEAAA
jgi:transposase